MPDVNEIIERLDEQMRSASIYCTGPAVPWMAAREIAVAAVREAAQAQPARDNPYAGPCDCGHDAPRCQKWDEGFAAGHAADQQLRDALREIRDSDKCGRVCDNYELCDHRACASSYNAWAIADAALAASSRDTPFPEDTDE